jgi:hypothetical protein
MDKPVLFSKTFIAIVIVFACCGTAVAQQEVVALDSLVAPPMNAASVTVQDTTPSIPILNRDFTLEVIHLFPNPATNELNVRAENMKQIEIMNMIGSIVIKKEQCEVEERIDISDLREGLYFIRVTTGDNAVRVEKFIKK